MTVIAMTQFFLCISKRQRFIFETCKNKILETICSKMKKKKKTVEKNFSSNLKQISISSELVLMSSFHNVVRIFVQFEYLLCSFFTVEI